MRVPFSKCYVVADCRLYVIHLVVDSFFLRVSFTHSLNEWSYRSDTKLTYAIHIHARARKHTFMTLWSSRNALNTTGIKTSIALVQAQLLFSCCCRRKRICSYRSWMFNIKNTWFIHGVCYFLFLLLFTFIIVALLFISMSSFFGVVFQS